MRSNGYLHIIIATAFIFYMVIEIKDFYESKPHNDCDRKQLLTTKFPALMDSLVYNLPKPDRQWQLDRHGGAVTLNYYYYHPNEYIIKTIQENIKKNECKLNKHGVNETLYCKEGIVLIVGNGITPENTPYVYLTLSWQSRNSECKSGH